MLAAEFHHPYVSLTNGWRLSNLSFSGRSWELPLGMNLSMAEISRFLLKAQVFVLISALKALPSISPIPP